VTDLRTTYDFTLPRGYVDDEGRLHRTGTMRLATARDELEPLRDPTVQGPDDPRLTILVLTRVITALGDLELITTRDIEGLFAVDLAFLQDFYGVINFGNQAEFEALVQAQASADLVGSAPAGPAAPAAPESEEPTRVPSDEGAAPQAPPQSNGGSSEPRGLRHAVEELPRRTS
jgi:hypothetical protein